MSNRKKLRPPGSVLAMARSYKCGHCNSEAGKPWFDGVAWHLSIHHDDECPVLSGSVPFMPAGRRATASAAAETGERILYLGLDQE